MLMYGYPDIFKNLLTNFPTVAFKTVPMGSLIKDISIVSKRYLAQEIPDELISELIEIAPKKLVVQNDKIKKNTTIPGEILLELFFAQLKNPYGIFLDLRSEHFAQGLRYKPSSLWYKFDPEFCAHLIHLYQGFYFEDEILFDQSLSQLGLSKNLAKADKEKLSDLFHEHFFTAQGHTHFKLAEFNHSFNIIFEFMIKHKIELSVDFIFLGLYLTTLYLHLEKHTSQGFDVSTIFKKMYPLKVK